MKTKSFDNLFNTALKLHKSGNYQESIKYYKKAVKAKPESIEAHSNMGAAFISLQKYNKSIECFKKAIKINPGEAMLYNNLGIAFKKAGSFNEAIDQFKKAISINPDNSIFYNHLGTVLHKMDKFYDALLLFKKSLSMNDKNHETLYNIGNIFQKLLYIDDAVLFYEKSLSIKPDYAKAHYNLSLALLLKGDFLKGFKEYEWRYLTDDFTEQKRNFTNFWDGSIVEDKTLLIYSEQGFGDVIQFIRYLPLVKKRIGNVILEIQSDLKKLITNSNLADKVIIKGEKLPDFDICTSILNLPGIFQTEIESIPDNVPYLNPGQSNKKIKAFFDSLDNKFKIGIVWAGAKNHPNDENRSINLSYFKQIFGISNCTFISLQKGIKTNEIINISQKLINADFLINDFCDTASIIKNLDLVITVDTSVAHLAGALGVKTWVLLPYYPDWRWMLDRSDSPWYPHIKLFRQIKFRDWVYVFNQVYNELTCLINKKADSYKKPSNKKAIVTLAIGAPYLLNYKKFCKTNWEAYALKHGYDIYVFDKAIDSSIRASQRSPAWQKCLILEDKNIRKYKQVVWIDSDIMINYENSPCICENVPVEKIGAVNSYANPSPEIYQFFLKRMYDSWEKNNISYIDNLSSFDFYSSFGLDKGFKDVLQTGVMVLSPECHSNILRKTYDSYEEKKGAFWNYEMRPLSYEIIKNKFHHWIDYRFNTDWLFEKYCHYPFLLSSVSSSNIYELLIKCVTVSYLNSFFLHFAGISSEMQFVNTKIKSVLDI